MSTFPPRRNTLCFGGDYNPEQWSSEVWRQDATLMRAAGVNLVTIGVFSWAWLEPAAGRYEFGWLDEVMDLMAEHDIQVDLATATASPPPWFSQAYPRAQPVDHDGRRLWYGSRQAYCPSSPAYRDKATDLVERLADRYGRHPALVLWHINNEYGCHVARCYCDVSAGAFRDWLADRYKDTDTLNEAWGTAFWSQRYGDWSEVLPPRLTPTHHNPAHVLDFARFSSDALLELYRAELAVLRRHTPDIPVTTNLMPTFTALDYWRWAPHLDVVSTDHYLTGTDPRPEADVAFAADLSRSLGDAPWLLMEHSTSAVNWQPWNVAKRPGQILRNAMGYVGRGADGAMFFQWRASRAGAEKWHSAMLPHAGTDSKIWREVIGLGAALGRLGEVSGSTVDVEVAIVFDYPSAWAQERDSQPSVDMTAFPEVQRWHRVLWRLGITADLAPPGRDLSRYRAVLVPSLYLISDTDAASLKSYVDGGGTLLVGAYSGIVDEHDRVRLGGYPGAFTDLLGVRIEEFFPLLADECVELSDGSTGTVWSELGEARGAEVIASYTGTSLTGSPALTRHRYGTGTAWYVGTRLVDEDLARLVQNVCGPAGVQPVPADWGVEAVRRRHPSGTTYLFLLNHGGAEASVRVAGTDLISGAEIGESLTIPAGGVAVVRADKGE